MPFFKLSAKAKIDLKKIAIFTEKRWGRTQRNAYLLQFDQCFHQLADHSTMGITCNHIKAGYRQFQQGSHLIFYTIGNKGIVGIIRILHKNMLPKFHL
ncbi:hypothetical protein MNBD_GAMMA26-1114 [hydrothermal vent metagenome]|uniref:Toxin n=1 Tax=hydrothermal vent metagenome TaxID=652676 RepID=A0A3B1AMU4_9ZZZZ